MLPHDAADPYLQEKLRKALAEDARVGETNIRVAHAGGCLWISGSVASEERRVAALLVAREIAGDIEIRNDIEVLQVSGPTTESIG